MNLMQSILLLGVVFNCLMIAGFFKPSLLLWWQDMQTRLGVIKVYGAGAAISYLAYWMLKLNS